MYFRWLYCDFVVSCADSIVCLCCVWLKCVTQSFNIIILLYFREERNEKSLKNKNRSRLVFFKCLLPQSYDSFIFGPFKSWSENILIKNTEGWHYMTVKVKQDVLNVSFLSSLLTKSGHNTCIHKCNNLQLYFQMHMLFFVCFLKKKKKKKLREG